MPVRRIMSLSSGAQSSFRFCADSVETKPKLISLGSSAAAGRMTTLRVRDAKNLLSHMQGLRGQGGIATVVGKKRNVIGQRQDLVGLGSVELAQQRGRQGGRGDVVTPAHDAQLHR